MKSPKILEIFIRLVMYREVLLVSYVLFEYNICERTLYYYLGDINEVIRINLGLEAVIRDGIVKVIKFE